MSWESGVAEFHELQDEKLLLIHLPFETAVERLLFVLARNGKATSSRSNPHRVTAVGTWRPGVRVRYELTITSTAFAQATVAQFFSQKPDQLARMLRTHLLPQLRSDGSQRQHSPAADDRPRSVSARRDIQLGITNYDGGLPGHPRPERKAKLVLRRGTPTFALHWHRAPKGTSKTTSWPLSQYSLDAQPAGTRSSHLVVTDRRSPSVVAHLDLPTVSAARFRDLLDTKIRDQAMSWRPAYRATGYNGGLPSHPNAEAAGTFTLLRSTWTLRFPGTEQLFHGLITDGSPSVMSTGTNSCRVGIIIPQRLGQLATFDLPDCPAETMTFELATRKELDPDTTKPPTPAETAQILKTTRQPGLAVSGQRAKKTSPAAALVPLAVIALAVGIALAALSSSKNSGTTGTNNAAATDGCPAGYGYFDTQTGECYKGVGPSANNAAGTGKSVNCPTGYPYYNAGTDQCYTSIPGVANSGVGTNASTNITTGGGGGGSGSTTCSKYKQSEGGGEEVYYPQTVRGPGRCYLDVAITWQPYAQNVNGDSVPQCFVNGGQAPSDIPGRFINVVAMGTVSDEIQVQGRPSGNTYTIHTTAYSFTFDNGPPIVIECGASSISIGERTLQPGPDY